MLCNEHTRVGGGLEGPCLGLFLQWGGGFRSVVVLVLRTPPSGSLQRRSGLRAQGGGGGSGGGLGFRLYRVLYVDPPEAGWDSVRPPLSARRCAQTLPRRIASSASARPAVLPNALQVSHGGCRRVPEGKRLASFA